MPLKDTDFKKGDRVRSVRWGKLTSGSNYIGAEGTVLRVKNDVVEVKLDNDPIASASSCHFWPSELEHINEGENNTGN